MVLYVDFYLKFRTGIRFTIKLIIRKILVFKSNNNNYLNNNWLTSNIISSITYVYYRAYYVESRTGISFTILLKVRKILVFKVGW